MKTETAVEQEPPWSWAEDVLLVALFALVGALGMAAGLATDSQVETSLGLLMFVFAAKVLADVLARAQNE
jgi:hypothetical protein